MRYAAILAPLLAAVAMAQFSRPYTDSRSGITFQALIEPNTGYTFGIVLPTTPGTDFIGHLTGKGTGWAGVSLGGLMVNRLLLVAWPNGQSMVSTFRKATTYASPPVASGAWSIKPIAKGTYTNSTHWAFTFVCSKCITSDGLTFNASATSATLGWAIATQGPSNKASASTTLNQHNSQGNYGLDLGTARSSNYATWAALAT